MAEKLVFYFLAQANKIWVSDSFNDYDTVFEKIKNYMYQNNLREVRVRDIAQKKYTKNTEELRKILQHYADRDLIKCLMRISGPSV